MRDRDDLASAWPELARCFLHAFGGFPTFFVSGVQIHVEVISAGLWTLLECNTSGVISLSFTVKFPRSKSVRVVGEGGEHKVMADPIPL